MTNELVKSHSLFELEEALCLLVEAAEQESTENLDLLTAIGEYLEAATEKRDRLCQFLTHLESQREMAKVEIRRLRDRESSLARQQDRLETYVIRFMESRGLKRLDGKTSALSLRGCPASVQILDDKSIPAQFLVCRQEYVPDKKAIKAAIEAGTEVPGADLQIGRFSLMRR